MGVSCEHRPTVIPLSHRSSTESINFRIGTLNVGTMRGRSSEIVEMITRRKIDICTLQEVRWRGGSARMITGKDSSYKFFWVGNSNGTGGVGVLLAEKWIKKVFHVERISDRILIIKLLVGERCCFCDLSLRPPEWSE